MWENKGSEVFIDSHSDYSSSLKNVHFMVRYHFSKCVFYIHELLDIPYIFLNFLDIPHYLSTDTMGPLDSYSL